MFTGLNPSGNSWSNTSSVKIGGVRRPCIWVYRGVRIFVVLHCMLERACLARRWIWLHRPFDVRRYVHRLLACVWRRLPLYVGHEDVYPTGWPF